MTIREVLKKGIELLKAANVETPAVDAGVILCHVINRDKTFLYSHDEYVLSENENISYLELIYDRTRGKPLQYITGQQEFMSLDFTVRPGVLIPRQDTEILVETLIKHAGMLKKGQINILDIGTGSGCIAISLAHYIKEAIVTAVDISEEALQTADINVKRNNEDGRVKLIKSNLFEALDKNETFDVIVSNPPYIPSSHIDSLQREVRDFEPGTALDGGVDGLDFYRTIVKEAGLFLKPAGLLAFEVGFDQAGLVAEIMEKDFSGITIIKDLSQIDRVVMGYHK